MNERDIPRFRDAGLNPVGQLRGQKFADKKQSAVLSKMLKLHTPKKPLRRSKGRHGKTRTIEADKNAHFHFGKSGVFY
jgi:hypothetical protein